MALSEFAVRKAKPRDKAYKLADGSGLHLFIQPGRSQRPIPPQPFPGSPLAETKLCRYYL